MTIEVEVGNIVQVVDDRNLVVIDQGNTVEVAAVGAQGPTGPTGATGPQGPSGVISVTAPITNSGSSTSAVIGVNVGTTSATVAAGDRGLPAGGSTGQALVKTSATDYATGWADPGSLGGLVLLSKASFTAVTSWSLPASSFSSTYTNYKLVINVSAVAANATFTGRMRTGGTDATGNNYLTMFLGLDAVNAAFNSTSNGTSSFVFGEMRSTWTANVWNLDLYSPFEARPTWTSGTYFFLNNANTALPMRVGGTLHNVATSYDSFSFISNQNMTGTYALYGYR